MYKYYFPACPVEGEILPAVSFNHLGLEGAIPKKCASCQFMFEGGCKRALQEGAVYLHLDHGACGVDGPTNPVVYENPYLKAKVTVPRKCATCYFLQNDPIKGFYCNKDKHVWGFFDRGLDWGVWEPDTVYIALPLPKVTTKLLRQYAHQDNQNEFIREYRRVNPGRSLKEAKEDFEFMKKKLLF